MIQKNKDRAAQIIPKNNNNNTIKANHKLSYEEIRKIVENKNTQETNNKSDEKPKNKFNIV